MYVASNSHTKLGRGIWCAFLVLVVGLIQTPVCFSSRLKSLIFSI